MSIKLRDAQQVKRAYNMLRAAIIGEVSRDSKNAFRVLAAIAALDTLCWVMGHEHDTALGKTLTGIEAAEARRGKKKLAVKKTKAGK